MASIVLKWLGLTALDYILAPIAYLVAPFIAAFTREEPDVREKSDYTWGWIFGTYDNPPQGDQGYLTQHAYFLGETTGLKGYINRVGWMWRNPLYTYQKWAGVQNQVGSKVTWVGDSTISDKYARPGWYFAKLADSTGDIKAWEFYMVKPYTKNKCLRVRLGWKIMTDKLERFGFAPLVDTVTPVKEYGGSV